MLTVWEAPLVRRLRRSLDDDRGLAFVLFAYIVFLPVQIELAPRFRLALSDLVLVLGMLTLGFRLTVPRHMVGVWHGLLLMLFAAGSAVSFVRNGEFSTWALVNKTLGFVALMAIYLLTGRYANTFSRIVTTLHVMVGSVAVYNAIAVVAFVLGYESTVLNSSAELDRLAGGLVDPNAYGGLLVFCLVSYLPLRSTLAGRLPRAADLFVITSLAAGIMLTLSRSAWLALGLALAFLVWLCKEMRKPVLTAALIALIGFAAFGLTAASHRAVELATRSNTIEGRMYLNEAAIDEFVLNPFGIGIGEFQEKYGAIVHNTALWFAAELGVLGLVVFIGFLLWMVRRLVLAYFINDGDSRLVVIGLGLGFVSMLALSLSIEAFYQRHWWIGMAFIASASHPKTMAILEEE